MSKRRKHKTTLTPQHIEEARQRHGGTNTRERYSDDDFISKMLVKWTFRELLSTSKILLVIINRRLPPTSVPTTTPGPLRALLCYSHPCEYVETLFAEQTMILCDDVHISFRHYYNMVYREATKAITTIDDVLRRAHLVMLLRACFLIALVYDSRVRRFVFGKHDIHYEHLATHPPPIKKSRDYTEGIRASIDDFLNNVISINIMVESAVELWCERFMFRLI
jgi:hypothetical protein